MPMRKLLRILIMSSLLLIGACSSSGGAFTKHIKQASDLLNDMNYEEAIRVLVDVEENVLPGDTYETGRMLLVKQLKSEAEYMADHIKELKESYQESMSLFEAVQSSDTQDIELYEEALYSIDQTMNSFNDMTHLDMYQELTDAKEELTSEISDWILSLDKDIDDSLQSVDFASADKKLNEMIDLRQTFPEQVDESHVSKHEEKINKERERFVFVPELATKWNEVIIEDEDGSIEIEGIRHSSSTIELFISFKGYYQKLDDQIDLSLEMIYVNGDTSTGHKQETRLLEDEAIVQYEFSSGDLSIEDLVRININIPFKQEDDFQVTLDEINEDVVYEVPGVESIKALHTPDWTLEAKDFEVIINRLLVEDYNIEISGVVKPTNDVVVNDLSSVYLPFTRERDTQGQGIFGSVRESELYKGTEKEFELNYSFNKPITEYHDYIEVILFQHQALIDLENGELFEKSDPTFIEDVYKQTSDTTIGLERYDQTELINQSGNRVAVDSIMFTRNNISNRYYLSKNFDTFTATIHVHEDFSGVDYGTTELTIYSVVEDDEKELYSTTINEKHKATNIELDVSDVNQLLIRTSQKSGSKGRQKIILEKPMVQ